MKEQFIDRKKTCCYEGFDKATPSTNYALEALNGKIKMCHKLRDRLPVGRFLEAWQGMVRGWSQDPMERRKFRNSPPLTYLC